MICLRISWIQKQGLFKIIQCTFNIYFPDIPIFMIRPRILNEQVSLFEGTLSKDGQEIYSFNVLGFTDYSTL